MNLFFYGLFMDPELLLAKGLLPTTIGPARLDGYALRIGARASLVPQMGGESFGVITRLSSTEVDALYSETSVADYRAERVQAHLLADSSPIDAICYNLPPDRIGAVADRPYAKRLAQLAGELDLPPRYIDQIEAFC